MAVMDSHGHDHAHTPKNFGSMFAIATALNVALVAVQVFYGIIAHSVACFPTSLVCLSKRRARVQPRRL
jgi:Co/Zn/Cd efflux system component